MKKLIATHNKLMHADEVMAVALLKLFSHDEIVVHRVAHNTSDFSGFDMVIDIGRYYDGVKYFDHHQYKGGKSSAGLIWAYLKQEKRYQKISEFIKVIDQNDTGERKSAPHEFSSLIKAFNNLELSPQEQDKQFSKAVEFAITVLESMKRSQESFVNAQSIVKNSFMFDANPQVLELERFTNHWGSYINGKERPEIKAVVWEDIQEGVWKVRVPSKRAGSFELNGRALQADTSMEFVHSAGFFAIAKDEECMKKFIKKHLPLC